MRLFVAFVCLVSAASAVSNNPSNTTADACGCLNGGQCMGDTGKCRCAVGFAGEKCHIGVKCCNIYGDPHYLTFDGAKVDFQGECRYQAAGLCPCAKNKMAGKLPNFQVRVENWRRGKVTKVSWTRMVEVEVAGSKVTIDWDKDVHVDDVLVSLPYKSIPGASIDRSGKYIRLTTNFGASVSFDSRDSLLICLPTDWQGATCGLCGNFNGKFRDDYVTKDGTNVFSMEKSKRSILIGNSWQLPSDSDSDECKTEKHIETPRPSKTWENMAKSKKFCGAIIQTKGPFAKCISKLGNDKINNFYENCKFDVFELHPDQDEAKTMACDVLAALLKECQEIGVAPDNSWRKYTSCLIKCPKHTVYKADMSSCEATCADPDAPKNCLQANTEGCDCKEGYIFSDDKCIPRNRCGCTDVYGTYHQVRSKWFNKECTKQFYCKSGKLLGDLSTIVEIPGCKKGTTCKAVGGMVKCVKLPVPGGWTKYSKWSECSEFCGQDHPVRVRTRRCEKPKPKYGGKCGGEPYELQICL